VVTNQHLIGEGIITEQEYRDFASQVLAGLRAGGVDPVGVDHCPHSRSEACRCRKPNAGLVERALAEHPELTLDGALVVGDSDADTGLALNLGIPAVCLGEVPPNPLVTPADGWAAVVGVVEGMPENR
jgi:D-glycero-D-manno-heptose 1,7-bisphosphate phosphatase